MPTKSLKQAMAVGPKPGSRSKAPVAKAIQPKILTRVEQLKVLSKLEQANALSTLENFGITLKFIEENKLLSKAEDLGVIPLVLNRNTPGSINTLGFVLLAAAIASVFAIPDDAPALVVVQLLLAGSLGAGGIAALAGAGFLADLQKA